MTNEDNMQVAQTILAQLGGRMFTMMTGAKQMTAGSDGLGSLSMRIGQNCHHITALKVVLEPSDTYTLTFYRGLKVAKTFEDVYCDQLRDIFTEVTGMYTSL